MNAWQDGVRRYGTERYAASAEARARRRADDRVAVQHLPRRNREDSPRQRKLSHGGAEKRAAEAAFAETEPRGYTASAEARARRCANERVAVQHLPRQSREDTPRQRKLAHGGVWMNAWRGSICRDGTKRMHRVSGSSHTAVCGETRGGAAFAERKPRGYTASAEARTRRRRADEHAAGAVFAERKPRGHTASAEARARRRAEKRAAEQRLPSGNREGSPRQRKYARRADERVAGWRSTRRNRENTPRQRNHAHGGTR